MPGSNDCNFGTDYASWNVCDFLIGDVGADSRHKPGSNDCNFAPDGDGDDEDWQRGTLSAKYHTDPDVSVQQPQPFFVSTNAWQFETAVPWSFSSGAFDQLAWQYATDIQHSVHFEPCASGHVSFFSVD